MTPVTPKYNPDNLDYMHDALKPLSFEEAQEVQERILGALSACVGKKAWRRCVDLICTNYKTEKEGGLK